LPPALAGGKNKSPIWALTKLSNLAKAQNIQSYFSLQLKLEAIEKQLNQNLFFKHSLRFQPRETLCKKKHPKF